MAHLPLMEIHLVNLGCARCFANGRFVYISGYEIEIALLINIHLSLYIIYLYFFCFYLQKNTSG